MQNDNNESTGNDSVTYLTKRYENELARQPGNIEATCNLAALLSQFKEYSAAISLLKSALHYHPNDEWLLFRLASTYSQAGEYFKAKGVAEALWEAGFQTDGVSRLKSMSDCHFASVATAANSNTLAQIRLQ